MTAFASLADALPYGVLLLDEGGYVTFRNREAQAMLEEADGLALKDRALHALRKSDDARLQRIITRAHAGTTGSHVMTLERPSGRLAYGALVVPIDTAGSRPADPAVMVLVSDPMRRACLDQSVLRHLFGLTRAEAALLVYLVDGLTLQQAAAEQKIATRTARVHLRNVFTKTGVRRQSDLIRAVCMSVAMLASMESAAMGLAPVHSARYDAAAAAREPHPSVQCAEGDGGEYAR